MHADFPAAIIGNSSGGTVIDTTNIGMDAQTYMTATAIDNANTSESWCRNSSLSASMGIRLVLADSAIEQARAKCRASRSHLRRMTASGKVEGRKWIKRSH